MRNIVVTGSLLLAAPLLAVLLAACGQPDSMPVITPVALVGDQVPPVPTITPTDTPVDDALPVPTDAPPADTPPGDAAGQLDEVAIYAAVVRQLYAVDHTFGEPPNWPEVYVVGLTDDSVGGWEHEETDPRVLPEDVQQGISAALADLPAQIIWVGHRSEAPLTDDGLVAGGEAVIITLGNLHTQPDGTVQVPASLHCGSLCATGMTYVLVQVDGVWQVIDTTGPAWIS